MATLSIANREMPFEVHLPEIVGRGVLETVPGHVFFTLGRIDLSMANQYRVNCTGGLYLNPFIQQHPTYRRRSPRRLLGSHSQHLLLKLRLASSRRTMRTSGLVDEPLFATLSISTNPLIGGGRTYPVSSTQPSDVRSRLAGQLHKLHSRLHH